MGATSPKWEDHNNLPGFDSPENRFSAHLHALQCTCVGLTSAVATSIGVFTCTDPQAEATVASDAVGIC